MIMVRTVFRTKWGKANEVVQGMKEMMNPGAMPGEMQNQKVVLMTDLSGEFHTVVMEARFESLAAYEQFRTQMFASDEFQNNQEEDDLILSGRQEFYTIEAEF
jgi:hypothetical protein